MPNMLFYRQFQELSRDDPLILATYPKAYHILWYLAVTGLVSLPSYAHLNNHEFPCIMNALIETFPNEFACHTLMHNMHEKGKPQQIHQQSMITLLYLHA